jgi:hypothetical protein
VPAALAAHYGNLRLNDEMTWDFAGFENGAHTLPPVTLFKQSKLASLRLQSGKVMARWRPLFGVALLPGNSLC